MDYRPKSADEIRRNMSAIRSRDNRAELALRRALHRKGLRFRLHRRDLPGSPDLIFVREQVAVFVDGDFWHARRLREEGLGALTVGIKTPKRAYWLAKFQRRVARDDEVTAALRQRGWLVLRYWESDLRRNEGIITDAIERAVLRRRRRKPKSPSQTEDR